MRLFKPLLVQLLGIFLLIIVAWAFVIYLLLPYLGIDIPGLQAALFMIQAVIFSCFSLMFIYFFTEKFNKKIQLEIKRTSENINRYEALNNATNDAVWDHDLVTGETFYNNRLMKIFGYPQEDLKDNESWWLDNIHPADRERVKKKIDDILQNIDPHWQDEYQFRCKDGSYKIVQDRSYIVRDITGKPIRLIGAMNDITRERLLQQEIVKEKLDKKNNLGKAIIQAQEEEKKLIREELHEDVNQILASIKICIHQISNQQGENESIKTSIIQLDDVMNKIRKISNQLAPSGLEYFGLVAAIREIIEFEETQHPVTVHFYHNSFDESKVDNPLRILLYSSIKDLFSSMFATPGAKPTEISVDMQNTGRKIQVSITDNRHVLDINQLISQRGINIIRNKLEMYNGQIGLTLQENKTAEVRITL